MDSRELGYIHSSLQFKILFEGGRLIFAAVYAMLPIVFQVDRPDDLDNKWYSTVIILTGFVSFMAFFNFVVPFMCVCIWDYIRRYMWLRRISKLLFVHPTDGSKVMESLLNETEFGPSWTCKPDPQLRSKLPAIPRLTDLRLNPGLAQNMQAWLCCR